MQITDFTGNKTGRVNIQEMLDSQLSPSSTASINPVTIFLKDSAQSIDLQLPVNPTEIVVRRERQVETVNILNLGEVDFKLTDKIEELTFQSFFPAEYHPGYCVYPDIPIPLDAFGILQKWCVKPAKWPILPKDPVRMIITGTNELNMMVNVVKVEATDKGGEPGDLYFTMTVRKHREIKVRTTSEQKQQDDLREETKPVPKTVPPPATNRQPVASTKVAAYLLSKKYFGTGIKANDIAKLNPGWQSGKPVTKVVMPL